MGDGEIGDWVIGNGENVMGCKAKGLREYYELN